MSLGYKVCLVKLEQEKNTNDGSQMVIVNTLKFKLAARQGTNKMS